MNAKKIATQGTRHLSKRAGKNRTLELTPADRARLRPRLVRAPARLAGASYAPGGRLTTDRATARSQRASHAEVGEHGEHAAVVVRRLVEFELREASRRDSTRASSHKQASRALTTIERS